MINVNLNSHMQLVATDLDNAEKNEDRIIVPLSWVPVRIEWNNADKALAPSRPSISDSSYWLYGTELKGQKWR